MVTDASPIFLQAPGSGESERARKHFVNRCEFVLGAPDVRFMPPADRPEVCFAGRSNCGKSSLITALANRRKLARTSNTPGRTREINVFTIGSSHYLADLPGYGYARMPKQVAARASRLINTYLVGRASLRRVFLLIDGRRGPMTIDEEFMARLDGAGVTFQLVITKLDKIAVSDVGRLEQSVSSALQRHAAAFPAAVGVSAVTGAGINTLRSQIAAIL